MKTYRNRKLFFVLSWICLLAVIVAIVGCQSTGTLNRLSEKSPVKHIRISAITEFIPDPVAQDRPQIKTLVELLDRNGISVKAPCQFRFELYDFHPVSSDPRGKRLFIWPNEDLTGPEINSQHWEKFLRGYEFFLPLDMVLENGKKYILEVTCLVDRERYSDLFKMKH